MSIFNDENKQKGNWWKAKKVGDLIEGTLIGKRMVPNRINGGEQNAYDIKVSGKIISEGIEIATNADEVWTVFGKPGIDAQMRYSTLGQIVGFKFTNKIPATRPGMNDTHVIQVYSNPDILDEEWLKKTESEREAVTSDGNSASGTAETTPQEIADTATPTAGQATPQNTDTLLEEINQLATKKLGTKTPEEMKEKVMEATKLAFIESNLAQIKGILTQLADKV